MNYFAPQYFGSRYFGHTYFGPGTVFVIERGLIVAASYDPHFDVSGDSLTPLYQSVAAPDLAIIVPGSVRQFQILGS